MARTDNYAGLIRAACKGQLELVSLVDAANALDSGGEHELAATLYRTWLHHNSSPNAHLVEFNLGGALMNAGLLDSAEQAFRSALARVPRFVHPQVNLGSLYERQGRIQDALDAWREVASRQDLTAADLPVLVTALNHLGRVLETLKQYDECLRALERSLALDPAQSDVLHHLVFVRQRICAWPILAPLPGVGSADMLAATSALAMIGITDDPAIQLAAARRYVDKKVLQGLPRLSPGTGYGHRKLRIGYLSSDFCLHPVAMLIVEMLELHDRADFEVHAYSWTRNDGSALRERVIKACDRYEPIGALDDAAAARLIREHEIDILIDLQGQTAGARANILAHRPAPIQVTYLGLPATTAFPEIDLVIADRFLIPPEQAVHYSERPLYMPDIYMVSDRQRTAAPAPTRASCGLPESGFVFCSFNNSFKYTPEVFGAWLEILQRVPGSVLWLLADNSWAEAKLRQVAGQAGLENRLVFATRTSPETYLARYLLADLFLDTFPFNAGTTANDCLWMGCPLLTLTGRSFAARMAGAMLTAAGLPELISGSLAEYRDKAVALANDAGRCAGLRQQLGAVRASGALFDTPRFVRALESEFRRLAGAAASAQK